jgi:hypothetical protein
VPLPALRVEHRVVCRSSRRRVILSSPQAGFGPGQGAGPGRAASTTWTGPTGTPSAHQPATARRRHTQTVRRLRQQPRARGKARRQTPSPRFVSSAERHGGQEATILSLNYVFCHWGCVIVPWDTPTTSCTRPAETLTAPPGPRAARPPCPTPPRSTAPGIRAADSPASPRRFRPHGPSRPQHPRDPDSALAS